MTSSTIFTGRLLGKLLLLFIFYCEFSIEIWVKLQRRHDRDQPWYLHEYDGRMHDIWDPGKSRTWNGNWWHRFGCTGRNWLSFHFISGRNCKVFCCTTGGFFRREFEASSANLDDFGFRTMTKLKKKSKAKSTANLKANLKTNWKANSTKV